MENKSFSLIYKDLHSFLSEHQRIYKKYYKISPPWNKVICKHVRRYFYIFYHIYIKRLAAYTDSQKLKLISFLCWNPTITRITEFYPFFFVLYTLHTCALFHTGITVRDPNSTYEWCFLY